MTTDIFLGDCLEVMKELPDSSVDMVLCDLPYGTTACKWDEIIPFEPLWFQYHRVCKNSFVLFAAQPFTSALVMSNVKEFKYSWVWDKVTARGHLVAAHRPMAGHEDVVVFYKEANVYNPQMTLKPFPERGRSVESSRTSICGGGHDKGECYYSKNPQLSKNNYKSICSIL